jgi:hypothetical protein
MSKVRFAFGSMFAALSLISCRDCPEGTVPGEGTQVVQEGPEAGVDCAVVPMAAGCVIHVRVPRQRTTINCVPAPPPEQPPAIPNPGSFSPLDLGGYEWTAQAARPILDYSRLDMEGTTFSLPAQGSVQIQAFDYAGNVSGTTITGWSRESEDLRLSNPQAVAQWMADVPHACGFDVILNTGVQASSLRNGEHMVSLGMQYNGVVLERASVSFGVSGGQILQEYDSIQ